QAPQPHGDPTATASACLTVGWESVHVCVDDGPPPLPWTGAHYPRFGGVAFLDSGGGAQGIRLGECAQLLQALVLDLADPLAGDVERPSHLVERARVLAVEPVAELEHAALAMRERAESLLQRLPAHRRRR